MRFRYGRAGNGAWQGTVHKEIEKRKEAGIRMHIILASASPRRRELLSQIGLEYEVAPSTVKEEMEGALPAEIVQGLAVQKAEDVFRKMKEAGAKDFLVIGADTVVSLEGAVMGKPADVEDACRMLESLQGRTHQVYTGVALLGEKEGGAAFRRIFHEKTDVTMYPMTKEEIAAYVETKEPMDKAGAYGIQGRCAAHIEKIDGDYNNVVGLPAGRLYQELKKCGI